MKTVSFPPTRVFEGTSDFTSAEVGIIILYMPVLSKELKPFVVLVHLVHDEILYERFGRGYNICDSYTFAMLVKAYGIFNCILVALPEMETNGCITTN